MKIIKNRNNKERKIAAVGMYDGVHRGHQFLISYLKMEAVRRGLHPAVVTFREHPRTLVRPLEAPSMLTELDERMRLLSEQGLDHCILITFTDTIRRMTARKFLGALHDKYGVDALVVGFNNRFGHDRVDGLEQYKEIGKEIGIDVVSAPELKSASSHISSSIVRKYLSEGDVKRATQALSRPYRLRGTVVQGKRLGRSLGFPTANIKPANPASLIPRAGAYAVIATTPDGVRRPAMLNIGYRPTVDNDHEAQISIEVNILDFNGYLYGEEIAIDFIDFMRPERKFKSTDKLKEQLAADAKKAHAAIEEYLSPKLPKK